MTRGTSERARARAADLSPLPDDWQPSAADVQFALDEGIARPARVAAAFADYHRARGSLRCDWPAEFRQWCRRERDFARPYSRGPRGALEVFGLVPKYRNGFLSVIEDEGMPSAEDAGDDAASAFIAGYDRRMTDRAASEGNHG